MKVLALDVSVKMTGFAIGEVGSTPESGNLRFAPKGVSDDEVNLAGLRWVTEQLRELRPDMVAIERPFLSPSVKDEAGRPISNPATMEKLIGLQHVVRVAILAKTGKSAHMVAPSTARKVFTGRGNYPEKQAKPAVQRMCLAIGWLTPETLQEDRADALCVWAWACSRIDPSIATRFTPLFTEQTKPEGIF